MAERTFLGCLPFPQSCWILLAHEVYLRGMFEFNSVNESNIADRSCQRRMVVTRPRMQFLHLKFYSNAVSSTPSGLQIDCSSQELQEISTESNGRSLNSPSGQKKEGEKKKKANGATGVTVPSAGAPKILQPRCDILQTNTSGIGNKPALLTTGQE